MFIALNLPSLARLLVTLLPQPLSLGQHLVGARADANVLCEVGPPHRARGVHQELGRPGDVVSLRSGAYVDQVVTTYHFAGWIGENREGITSLFAEIARDLWWINADRNRSDTGCLKFG